MNKNKNSNQNKGITLIALIITIIVMLILVSATISVAVNGGLFEKARDAARKTNEALHAEQDMVEYIEDYINENIYNSKQTNYINIPNVNLYNKDETKVGYYVANGREATNANYMSTGYIAVEPGDVLYWCAYLPEYERFDYELTTKLYLLQNAQYIDTYDIDKKSISFLSTAGYTFDNNNEPKGWVVPNDVYYIRISFAVSGGRGKLKDTLFVCKNEPPKYYAGYNKETVIANYTIYLPEKIQICENTSFQILNSNICPTLYSEELIFKWRCDIGTTSADGISFMPSSGNIGNHLAKVYIYDKSNKIVASASTNIEVIPNEINDNKNILLIGDSLSNGKPWIKKVEELSGDNISITACAISGISSYRYL